MTGRWLCWLAAAAGALAFHLYYDGWASWYLLMLALALPLLSLLVSLPAMLRLRVRWNWPAEPSVPRGAPVTLRLGRRHAWLPAPRCRLRLEAVHLPSGQAVVRPLWLDRSEALPLDTSRCGVLRCHLTHGWVYDYLGLFRFPRRLPPARELTVLPLSVAPSPPPQLDAAAALRWQPKPGGGFAEQHELRAYRPGDPLHAVHWKLTAKTGELVIREAQEPVEPLRVVSFDLSPATFDRTLDQLNWLERQLLDRQLPHELRWLDPASGVLCRAAIRGPGDWQAQLQALLRLSLRADAPGLAGRHFPDAGWHCHIHGEPAGEEAHA